MLASEHSQKSRLNQKKKQFQPQVGVIFNDFFHLFFVFLFALTCAVLRLDAGGIMVPVVGPTPVRAALQVQHG